MKWLKSLEFRFKFGREERTRGKKGEKERTRCLCSNFQKFQYSVSLYSYILTFHAIVGLIDSSVLLGFLLGLGSTYFCPLSLLSKLSQRSPGYGLNPGLSQLFPSKRLKGGSCIFIDYPHWEILKLGSSVSPLWLNSQKLYFSGVFWKYVLTLLVQTHFLELFATCSRTHSSPSSSCQLALIQPSGHLPPQKNITYKLYFL